MAKKLENRLCTFKCAYAKFAKDAYCSANIGIYCKKYNQIILKFATCLDSKYTNKK